MNIHHRTIRTVFAAAALTICTAWVPAQAQVNVNINIGPPPPRYEVVQVVPQGYVWAPGYWAGQGRDYQWVPGRQIALRPGHRWVADHWEEGNRYRAGYWEPVSYRGRDRDRDHKRDHKRDQEDERDHDDDRGEKHHGKGHKERGDFCPPGQAKKGNC